MVEEKLAEKKPDHPAVKIASIVGGIVFVIVLMVAILAEEHMPSLGWVVIPLVVMAIALGAIASKS